MLLIIVCFFYRAVEGVVSCDRGSPRMFGLEGYREKQQQTITTFCTHPLPFQQYSNNNSSTHTHKLHTAQVWY